MSRLQRSVVADFDNPEGTLPWSAAASCGQDAPTTPPPSATPSVPARLPSTGGDPALSRWALAGAAIGGLVHLARRRQTEDDGSR